MKSTFLLGMLAGGMGIASLAGGCGPSPIVTTGSGGSGGETTASHASSTHATTAPSSSSTGTFSDGNDSFADAVTIDPMGTQGTLDDPSVDVDFYKFDGTAGDVYIVGASDHPTGTDGQKGYPDMYLELYDSSMKLIATNDDRYPGGTTDSELITVLPATGTYYVKVFDWCISPTKDTTFCTSDYFGSLTNLNYVVSAIKVDLTMAGNVAETEPNDTSATANPVQFAATTTAGEYYLTVFTGKLPMSSDADWYAFTMPSDLSLTAGTRANADFYFPWGSTAGNGSATKIGKVEVVDKATMAVISAFDMSAEPENEQDRVSLHVPVTVGGDYFLKITHGGAEADGQGQFYFAYESIGSGNTVEAQEAANNSPTTPEVLMLAANSVGDYYVEGDIAAGDVDHFKASTQSQAVVSVRCSAQRAGSGLRGLKATVLSGKDGTTVITSATETATTDIYIKNFAIPTGETDLIIKLEATGTQDATVVSKNYLCGIHMNPAP